MSAELRKDYILDRWVIISPKRGERPHQFKKIVKKLDSGKCYFCPGNEKETPAETGRIEKDGKWTVRWFPNKFPAVVPEGDTTIQTEKGMLSHKAAVGVHEVIVETNRHDRQLADLTNEELKEVLRIFSQRVEAVGRQKNVRYVTLFKNHGPNAGTSIVHSHSQLVSLDHVPPDIIQKIKASKNFGSCKYCRLIQAETASDRKITENSSFIAIAPYASRYNYEILIMPKKHVKTMAELGETQLLDLAAVLKMVLIKLKSIDASYNMVYYYAPAGNDLHLHIEILPRLSNMAGFELGSGVIINSVAPEDAAAFYRGTA